MATLGRTAVTGLALVWLLSACSSGSPPTTSPTPVSPSITTSIPSPSPSATPTPTTAPPSPTPTEIADPRWRFYEGEQRYISPWFAGSRRMMIGFGCTAAPYYSPDARCSGGQGFHHGIDIALPCGTPLTSGVEGTVLSPSDPGTPGPAYGTQPFRIRVTDDRGTHDVLVAHTKDVRVRPGDHVRPGQPIALAWNSGAPDGCHLHLEVRTAGGGVASAADPSPWFQLTKAG